MYTHIRYVYMCICVYILTKLTSVLCVGQVLSRDREEQALKLTSLMESAITSTSKPVYTYGRASKKDTYIYR
jgi:hypothetical protein